MNKQKINNIFSLESNERYGYLIRKVADFETIYLISDNDGGFVMIGSDGVSVLPVWPEKEFAELFLTDDWSESKVIEIEVYDFLEWLKELQEDGVQISGFPNPNLNAVRVSAKEIHEHLIFELNKYE
jgi:hypothetical protein